LRCEYIEYSTLSHDERHTSSHEQALVDGIHDPTHYQ
jgi:hypothetical protein